jgi:hypothetical protein
MSEETQDIRWPNPCRPQDCETCAAAAAELALGLQRSRDLYGQPFDDFSRTCVVTYQRHSAVRDWFALSIARYKDATRQAGRRVDRRTPLENIRLLLRRTNALLDAHTRAPDERAGLERGRDLLQLQLAAELKSPSPSRKVPSDPKLTRMIMVVSLWNSSVENLERAKTVWQEAQRKERRSRKNGPARQLLEEHAYQAMTRFLVSRDAYGLASYMAGHPEPRDRFPPTPPLYLADHLEMKADAAMRVVVGALVRLGSRPIDIVRVMSAARGAAVDPAQVRRLVRALRSS